MDENKLRLNEGANGFDNDLPEGWTWCKIGEIAAMHYNFSIKIKSKFDDPIPIRRAGYNGTLDMYDFVEYEP